MFCTAILNKNSGTGPQLVLEFAESVQDKGGDGLRTETVNLSTQKLEIPLSAAYSGNGGIDLEEPPIVILPEAEQNHHILQQFGDHHHHLIILLYLSDFSFPTQV